MEARAIVRNVRMTPRKIKLICDLIRGQGCTEAEMAIIMNTPRQHASRWRSSSRAQLPMPRTITA